MYVDTIYDYEFINVYMKKKKKSTWWHKLYPRVVRVVGTK